MITNRSTPGDTPNVLRRAVVALATGAAALVVACSGATTSLGPAADGGTGDGGGDGGGGDGGGCSVSTVEVTRACVPGTAKANVELTIGADADGCLGCGTELLPCDVDVVGSVIRVKLETRSCPLPDGIACPALCQQITNVRCTVPPLAEGTYTVDLVRSSKSSADIPRTLVVKNTGTATSCEIPVGGGGTPTMDLSGYADACTGDEDCALAAAGDVCQPCKCPDEAIAKSAVESYESDLRALQSLCRSRGGAASCAPCEARKPRCIGNKCVAGT